MWSRRQPFHKGRVSGSSHVGGVYLASRYNDLQGHAYLISVFNDEIVMVYQNGERKMRLFGPSPGSNALEKGVEPFDPSIWED